MEQSVIARRLGASVLSLAIVVAVVPPAGAVEPIVGTIQVSGAAWVASSDTDWSRLSSTRPLVAGDRLRTGSDGYLLADLGDAGVVGLYGNAEVTTASGGSGPVVDVQKGKVAFHLSPNSKMKLNAQGTGIASGPTAADGYVEYDAQGTAVVVVEDGALNVQTAAGDRKTLSRGERLALGTTPAAAAPVEIAQAEDDDSSRKAGAVAGEDEPVVTAGGTQYAGLSVPAWAGVAVVAGAIGGAAYYAGEDGDNGSDSPSGD